MQSAWDISICLRRTERNCPFNARKDARSIMSENLSAQQVQLTKRSLRRMCGNPSARTLNRAIDWRSRMGGASPGPSGDAATLTSTTGDGRWTQRRGIEPEVSRLSNIRNPRPLSKESVPRASWPRTKMGRFMIGGGTALIYGIQARRTQVRRHH